MKLSSKKLFFYLLLLLIIQPALQVQASDDWDKEISGRRCSMSLVFKNAAVALLLWMSPAPVSAVPHNDSLFVSPNVSLTALDMSYTALIDVNGIIELQAVEVDTEKLGDLVSKLVPTFAELVKTETDRLMHFTLSTFEAQEERDSDPEDPMEYLKDAIFLTPILRKISTLFQNMNNAFAGYSTSRDVAKLKNDLGTVKKIASSLETEASLTLETEASFKNLVGDDLSKRIIRLIDNALNPYNPSYGLNFS